jgi:hypothetical protein
MSLRSQRPESASRTVPTWESDCRSEPVAALSGSTGTVPDITGPTRMTKRPPHHRGAGGMVRKRTALEPSPDSRDVDEGRSRHHAPSAPSRHLPRALTGTKRYGNVSSPNEFVKADRRARMSLDKCTKGVFSGSIWVRSHRADRASCAVFGGRLFSDCSRFDGAPPSRRAGRTLSTVHKRDACPSGSQLTTGH